MSVLRAGTFRFEHPTVVWAQDCFEANNISYIVMGYKDGEPLDALPERHGTLTEAQGGAAAGG